MGGGQIAEANNAEADKSWDSKVRSGLGSWW